MKAGTIGYGSMGKMFLEKFLSSKCVLPENLLVSNRTGEEIGHLKDTRMGTVIELPEQEMGMGAELVSCMPGL